MLFYSVGGPAEQLVWDGHSERLAVIFRDCEYIAMFHTRSFPQLHLAPG